MNLFFEYLFCRHYWWFSQIALDRKYIDPTFHSILAMSVIHGWCIIPIYNLFYLFLYKSYYVDNIFGVKVNPYLFIGIIVTLIDFIYFNRKRRTVLWEQFKKMSKKEKRRKDIIVIVIVIIIIIINVSITVLFRSQNLK